MDQNWDKLQVGDLVNYTGPNGRRINGVICKLQKTGARVQPVRRSVLEVFNSPEDADFEMSGVSYQSIERLWV